MSTESTTATELPVLDDDPFGTAILTDPYDFHQRLRDAGPVVFLPRYEVYAMGRHEHVHASLVDWETFVSSRGAGLTDFQKEKPWRPPSLLLESDPPDHTAVRTVMGSVISPRTVRGLRTQFQAEADALVDALIERETIDAVTDLAEVYPLKVFPDAVGLPADGRHNLLPYGALAFNAFGPHNALLESAMESAAAVQEWIWSSCQREALTDSGFGADIWAAADRGEVSQEQAPLLVRSLLSAGVDTTVYGIANTMYALAQNPAEWELLHREPNLAKFAFDEALRCESPVQTFFRTSSRRKTVGGYDIPADAKVLLFLGSANRDPRKWGESADEYRITRSGGGHVAFGMGVHQCVGQPIARLEAEIVLGALARKVKRIELVDPPTPRLNNTLKGWAAIPLRLIAR
ncbi:cytochrome P450 [Rhodococcus opacus]|jgi:cytochrome P450|uniref:cytochrome P450 n=1 Tax=Rhodococcus opacus TaxID=37919 RepID=UPI0006BB4D0B|nr:cytochrome P450 [Rhodococcus opacus]MDJ0417914.1 cytochrome P450 [Rhodococcus opacus]MDV6246806.1 cytochrome P450 [Rhodococcus opacus]QZS56965.1 cytochrome P450 [Rhodococcus opacus]RKM76410.1 cytochrome P450 [Rhodococcus opacus]UZG52963.1 cytochrome P450 [Rhodococcus opacus]